MEPQPNSESAPSSKSSSNSDSLSRVSYLTLFPEVLEPFLNASLVGKSGVHFALHQIREFATDRHKRVDDTPYGGGPGMLLRVDVLHAAWEHARAQQLRAGVSKPRTILLSPQGPVLTINRAKALAQEPGLIFVCGHYEGVDERVNALCVDEELSIGDYVLTGGELAALVATDVILRFVPGVIGDPMSVNDDSLEGGLLKYPQYTRPREYKGLSVPDVLLSGDHGAIEAWRQAQRVERTHAKRPEGLEGLATGGKKP